MNNSSSAIGNATVVVTPSLTILKNVGRKRLYFGGFKKTANVRTCCDEMTTGEIMEYFWVQLFFLPICLFIGVLTNLIMFLVFNKKRFYSVHNFMHKVIAIANISLLITAIPFLFYMPVFTGIKISVFCKIASYCASVGITTVAACMVLVAVNCFMNASHSQFQMSKVFVCRILGSALFLFSLINIASVWVMKARRSEVFYKAKGSKPARGIAVNMCLMSENYFRYPSDIVFTTVQALVTCSMYFVILYSYIRALSFMLEVQDMEVVFIQGQQNEDDVEDDGMMLDEDEFSEAIGEKFFDDVTTVNFTLIIDTLFFVSMAPYYFITWRVTARDFKDLKMESFYKTLFDVGLSMPLVFCIIYPAIQVLLTVCGVDDTEMHVKELTVAVQSFPDRKTFRPPIVRSLYKKPNLWMGDDHHTEKAAVPAMEAVAEQQGQDGDAEAEAPEAEAPEGEAPEGEAPEGEGEAPEGEAPEGEAPEGEAPEGEAPEGEAPEEAPEEGEAPEAE